MHVTNWLEQTLTMHILPNISRSRDIGQYVHCKCDRKKKKKKSKNNQTMKFRQLIEDNVRNIFLQKSCKKWGRETSFRLLFVFKKVLYDVKASGLQLSLNTFLIALNLAYSKKRNCVKLDRLLIQRCAQFWYF